jgi:hypothetical protein
MPWTSSKIRRKPMAISPEAHLWGISLAVNRRNEEDNEK